MSAVLEQPELLLRTMRVDDLANVLDVERRVYSYPWSESIMRDCLRVGYSCWVCEIERQLVAHAVMSVAVGEAHLLNLCVDPDWQSKGIGRRLLRRMSSAAAIRNADTLFLEVRASNTRAMLLYESEGFVEIGQRRGYYPRGNGREDALVFARTLV